MYIANPRTRPLRRRTAMAAGAWLLLLIPGGALAAETVKMTFLSPEPPDNPFWGEAMDFMQAVADDIGVKLDVVVSNATSSYAIKKDGMAIIDRDDKPDYILTGYWNEASEALFEAGRAQDIDFFLFNTPLHPEGKRRLIGPRIKYSNWIGHILPDDVDAGRELARILVAQSRALKANAGRNTIEIGVLTGNENSTVGNQREAGLRQVLETDPRLAVNRTMNTSWLRDSAAGATTQILDRHPGTAVLWTVADALALGAIDVLKQRGLKPGVDIVTGGFDWSSEGLQAIRRGEMAASMGGHFMEGGWAMILAYDYHHGRDFAEDFGTTRVTPLQAVTRDNVDRYLEMLENRDWRRIDFRKFSKTHNRELEEYDFSLDALLEEEKQ